MSFQIPDNKDSGKDSEGCSNSFFDLDTLHENVPQGILSASASSFKNDGYPASFNLLYLIW